MTPIACLEGFDERIAMLMQQWNAPAVGVTVVADGKPVLTRGYGYREYEKQLPFDTSTLFPIASNTKLFVALAAGMLVEENKLAFDTPLHEYVPDLRMADDALTRSVTLRDLLSHRTGMTRHDMMTSQSDASLADLFGRLRFMKPSAGLRETFIYNDVMYYAVAYVIERLSGVAWTDFIRERILEPAGMRDTYFRFADLHDRPNVAVPFTARRDSCELYRLERENPDVPPRASGGMVSTLNDKARWVSLLVDEGQVAGRPVISKRLLAETLAPAMPIPNTATELHGWWESLNACYGLGRQTEVYRGHLLASHGGDIRGFHSKVSNMPKERIGVAVFVIGDHCAAMRDVVHLELYERLLELDPTPWNELLLAITQATRETMATIHASRFADRVEGTQPSHPLDDYAGEFAHPAYGTIAITLEHGRLRLKFRTYDDPLTHYHYDRFDTEPGDPEADGRWRILFQSTHEGDIDRFVTKMVENEVVFVRKEFVHTPEALRRFAGHYETIAGVRFEVQRRDDNALWLRVPGQQDARLVAQRKGFFRIANTPGSTFAFVECDGAIVSLDQMTAAGRFVHRRV